jgi:hypothetical protein
MAQGAASRLYQSSGIAESVYPTRSNLGKQTWCRFIIRLIPATLLLLYNRQAAGQLLPAGPGPPGCTRGRAVHAAGAPTCNGPPAIGPRAAGAPASDRRASDRLRRAPRGPKPPSASAAVLARAERGPAARGAPAVRRRPGPRGGLTAPLGRRGRAPRRPPRGGPAPQRRLPVRTTGREEAASDSGASAPTRVFKLPWETLGNHSRGPPGRAGSDRARGAPRRVRVRADCGGR